MINKKVAIVMPVHNSEKYLKRTIQGIIDQKYKNWDLLIIDDGSKDGSLEIASLFGQADHRIRLYDLYKNGGPAIARNHALAYIKLNSNYDYVAYCDSDDVWKNNHLEKTVAKLEEMGGTGMVYSDCDFVTDDGRSVTMFGIPYHQKFDRNNLKVQNFIFISTVVHSINCIREIENFDSQCVPMEDYDMWLRISETQQVVHIPEVTVSYTVKNKGSYYTSDESQKAQARVHLKNNINMSDRLEAAAKIKMDFVKNQKYEDAAYARHMEKGILQQLSFEFPSHIEGWLSKEEGEALAKYGKNGDCLEIGSYKGRSSLCISRDANSLICVDSFKADWSGQNQSIDYTTLQEFLNNVKERQNITPVIGKSGDVYGQFKDEQFDMIFIDGMHDYDSVQSDTKNYWPKLKVGGYMCFHDYQKDWPGVIRSVNENFGKPDFIHDTIAVVVKTDKDVFSAMKNLGSKSPDDVYLLIRNLKMSYKDVMAMEDREFNEVVANVKNELTKFKRASNAPRVLISPFSHKLPNGKLNPKNYPYFIELVELLRDAGINTIQIGVSGESLIGADKVIFDANQIELKKLLFESDAFISVDSFFPHFAHYHGKNGIVIFSQSDPNIFGYPENLNLLKSRDYLRKEQFWLWTQAEYNDDAFIPAIEVKDKVLEYIKLHKKS